MPARMGVLFQVSQAIWQKTVPRAWRCQDIPGQLVVGGLP